MDVGQITPFFETLALNKKPGGERQTSDLPQAAKAFEAYFIYSLLKEMRKTVPQDGFLGSGAGQEIYQSLFDEALANTMTERGGIGLSDLLIKKFLEKENLQVINEKSLKF